MMLDRMSWSLLGASLLAGCAAGYPDSRPSSGRSVSSGQEVGREADEKADEKKGNVPNVLSPAPSDASAAEPETWAESLDGYVFGSGRREAKTPGAGPGGDRASGADVRQLQAAGVRALEDGRTEDAFESFRAAYAASPQGERWQYLRMMANIRIGMRRDQEALDLYLELIKIQPGEPRLDGTLQGNLALLYYRLDRLPEARKAVHRALELDPAFPEALRTLGLIEIREGRLEIGVDLLEKAVALKRNIPEAQVALAEHEESVGRRAEAAARYRYLLEVMSSEGFQDPLERWRNLFGVSKQPTAAEFRARIHRLESSGENPDNARG